MCFLYVRARLCVWQDNGFTAQQATLIVLAFGIGCALGGAIGGVVGQKVYNKRARNLPLFIGACQMFALVPLRGLLNAAPMSSSSSDWDWAFAFITAFTTGLFSSVAGPNLKAILLNVNSPDSRGSVFTTMYLSDCVGNGFGPYILGNIIASTGSRLAITVIDVVCLHMCSVVVAVTVVEQVSVG